MKHSIHGREQGGHNDDLMDNTRHKPPYGITEGPHPMKRTLPRGGGNTGPKKKKASKKPRRNQAADRSFTSFVAGDVPTLADTALLLLQNAIQGKPVVPVARARMAARKRKRARPQ